VCRIQGPYAVIKGLGRIAQGSKGNKPIVTPVDILQKNATVKTSLKLHPIQRLIYNPSE